MTGLADWIRLPLPVVTVIGVVFAILVVATIVSTILRARRPGAAMDELVARVRSWWVMIVVITAALLVGRGAATIFLGFVSFLALKEFFSLVPTRRVDRGTLFFAYLTIPIQFTLAYLDLYGLFIVFIPVWAYLFIAMTMVLRGETAGFLRAVGIISWGLMMTVFTLSHMAFLLSAGDTANKVAGGAGLLVFLLFTAQFNDVAQYVWGRLFGRRKVVPTVSPGKTWEGLVGGIMTTALLASLIGPYLTEMPLIWSLASGLVIGIAGFIGDITMSALKRDLGVKDTGASIPGHGGVLDRVDSLTYAVPVFTHFYRFFFFP